MPNSNHWLQATIHSWMGTMVSKNAFALKKNHPELHFSCARYYFCSTKADQKSFGPLDGLLVDKRYFQSRSTGILGTNAKTRIGADTQCSTKCTCFQTVEGLYILNRKVGSILLVLGQTSLELGVLWRGLRGWFCVWFGLVGWTELANIILSLLLLSNLYSNARILGTLLRTSYISAR